MKPAFFAAALLMWQAAAPASNDPARHLRYERSVTVPAGTTGQTCAVLDGSVYVGAEGESLNDLRLYASALASVGTREVPFTLTESNTDQTESEAASVRNLGTEGGAIVFDLAMPHRPYTNVDLALDAKDFTGSAIVTGRTADDHAVELGEFAVFDLSAQHLSRSTTLPFQESTFPTLHVRLHLHPAPGSGDETFGSNLVTGASVPPSRSAQTLYTAVAQTTAWTQRGRNSVATVQLPAHVPVARVEVSLDPAFKANFLRDVTVTAKPLHPDANGEPGADAETVQGQISQVHMPPAGSTPGEVAIDNRQLSMDAVLAANLHGAAAVGLAVANGDDQPLPLQNAVLEMRQRRICFDAGSSPAGQPAVYTLMYGDKALPAPVYDYARLFVPSATAAQAVLGPEQPNPQFIPRADTRPFTERHPELLWIALLAALAALGSVALRGMRQQRGASR